MSIILQDSTALPIVAVPLTPSVSFVIKITL
jgi:hypothetical protein